VARESAILVEKIDVLMVSQDTVSVGRPSLCRSGKARADRSLGLGPVAVGSCETAGRPARNWAVLGGQRQLDLPLSDGNALVFANLRQEGGQKGQRRGP
jgi:hypothetical protein